MKALEYILEIHNLGGGGFWSVENPNTKASNSEIRRWLKNGVVHINGKAVAENDEIEEEIVSVVLFPKNNKKRITIK